MFVRKHRRCVVSDVRSECLKHGVLQLMEVFSMLIGNPEADIASYPELKTEEALLLQTN